MYREPRKKLRPAQTAEYLNLSLSTLAKWRMRGEGPSYYRCGRRIVFYYADELDAWLEKSRQCSPKA